MRARAWLTLGAAVLGTALGLACGAHPTEPRLDFSPCRGVTACQTVATHPLGGYNSRDSGAEVPAILVLTLDAEGECWEVETP